MEAGIDGATTQVYMGQWTAVCVQVSFINSVDTSWTEQKISIELKYY